MKKIQKGNLDISLKEEKVTEFSQIVSGINEMIEKLRIHIGGDNKDFCECLSNYIGEQNDMEIISVGHDGQEGYEKII